MKNIVEDALAPLIGEPLSDMWRYGGLQKFEFGVQRPRTTKKGKEIVDADWGLVVGCFWQISGPNGVVVSARDFGPVGAVRGEDTIPAHRITNGEAVSTEEFEQWRERRDDHAEWFYNLLKVNPPIVKSIDADENGGLAFHLAEGYTLEVVPRTETDDEQWRFMPKKAEGEERSHFVVTGLGEETRLTLQYAADSLNLSSDQFRILPYDEANDVARRIETRFVDEPGFNYLWEAHGTPNAASQSFPKGGGYQLLPRIIPNDTLPVWFIVDNASFVVCQIDPSAIHRLIEVCENTNHWSFEYYVAPQNLEWFVGETHQELLFAVGEPVVGNLRRETAG